MDLLSLNVVMGVGIAIMALAIWRSGRSYRNLKEKNDRQRRRYDAAYGENTTHRPAITS